MKLVRTLWWIFLLMPASVLFAQPAPTIVTTLQTTDTGATSVSVGCAVGSSTCTGGISFGSAAGNTISLSGGYLEIQPNVPVSQTYRLVNNAGTLQWNGIALASGSSLSGTTNTIPLFTASNAVGNSIMTQSGTTVTVATTLTATTLNGLLGTANQTGLTGVGTITSGVWNSTKIGLAYGGTNADLSGTGGTSQFLRQNSSGAAITVVRPATTDLSDGSNVALLNASNVFTGNFQQQAPSTATSNAYSQYTNTGGSTYVGADNSTGSGFNTGANYAGVLYTNSTGGLGIETAGATAIRFLTNATQRWGINSAGDWTGGTSADIVDSGGTPTFTGFGSGAILSGTDYAMDIFQGTTNSTGGTITFGHTWSNKAVCVASSNGTSSTINIALSTVVIGPSQLLVSTANTSNQHIYILCRGY